MNLRRHKIIVFIALIVLIVGLTITRAQVTLAQSCGNVELSCIDCDSGETFTYQCCVPSGCLPYEISNGDCNGPATCSYTCNGNTQVNYYYCGQ